ncbi:Type III secretion system, cytoplasmic E component of needle [Sulfidibacter corallicola]|uniref:Type III secretion system, E component of needle n=1 Tax=Sulfidibacter corallicola TaxID=2818388 RepID=A0A8A4TPX3_SULCO|nr:EscE/YscE/SsaE family type III secretion system needle protein co-chaperone [Sulfidibacter corallicola]QTD51132.1 hypothetical protein J3U87_01575 [Sulfidibacter corallicola]
MTVENTTFLDLETKLSEDRDGSFVKSIQERLEEQAHATKRAMDAGLAPDDFAAAGKLKESLETAQTVVEHVWRRLQQKSAS